jgi:hypothetical protein
MRSEIYVVNLVKASVRARTFMANLPGPWISPHRDTLLLRLSQGETLGTLATHLRCPQAQVFVKLAARMKRDIEGRFPPLFAAEHLHKLALTNTCNRLAKALSCDPEQALDKLFDVHAMLDTLFEVEPVEALLLMMSGTRRDSRFPPADITLLKLLAIRQKATEHYKINDFEWGRLLDEHRWLRNSALTRLRSYAVEQGFAQDTGANLLAAAIETDAYGGSAYEVHLDALAIVYIKQRIDWIVRQLRERAQELASEVADIVPVYSPLARLQSHVEFYELKAPATAWRLTLDLKETELPEPGPTVREKISDVDIRSTGISGTPRPSSYLRVRTEETWSDPPRWQFWKETQLLETHLIVSCEIEESDLPVDILVCSNVSPVQIASLGKFFTSLQGGVAAQGWVSDIGTRLLEARCVPLDTLREALTNACTRLLTELIRSLILAGVDLPCELGSVWGKTLGRRLPILPIEYDQDTIFPMSRADILDLVRQDYAHQDDLQIVE